MIGDNPGRYTSAARAIGARSIRVVTGRFAHPGHARLAPGATAACRIDAAAILQTQFGAAA